jgi:deleted-in-malignant-brain-tumors protein 1
MICKEGCSNGDVRLLGGGFDNEGTIQVCYGNLWGLISDSMWDDNDAQVICNQLGFSGGSPVAKTGSFYGKPNNTIYLKDVGCVGDEMNIDLCTKTKLSITNGKMELATAEVAGVDCQYDTPTEPPYVQLPSSFNTPGTECTNEAVRVTGSGQNDRGRLEYCYNGYWSPFCTLDPNTASVACKQLNFNTYSWATIYDNGGFGTGRNFSLFSSIMCTGTETALSQCNMTTNPSATPWCRLANVGLRCFSGTECTTEGEVRLVDGIIDNEGRVEVCTNGIWGAICSQGWDTTDAHVICTQLGYPQLEPYIFANSDFGGGDYPIVYSNSQCGGFEQTYTSCTKQTFPYSNCSRSNIAGVLCGYGMIRLYNTRII